MLSDVKTPEKNLSDLGIPGSESIKSITDCIFSNSASKSRRS